MRKLFFSFLLVCIASIAVQAQSRVSGVVKDGNGEPVIGASVLVQGTSTATVTDEQGRYTINAPSSSSILEFAMLGFETQAIGIDGRSILNVTMSESSLFLEETVVVGYGTQKKKNITGATVQVGSEKIASVNATNAYEAIQSMAPGVNIVQTSGQPGESYSVTIRGLGTTGSSSPLCIIDGVAGGSISDLDPSDIESIDILKDAASAAIYGARAANGVILITTKQGKESEGKRPIVTYNGYVGWQNLNTNGVQPLGAKEYMKYNDLAYEIAGSAKYDWESLMPAEMWNKIQSGEWNGTNWLEESLNKNAFMTNHAVGVNGGNEWSRFSLGVSYTKNNGTIGKPAVPIYDRLTVRLNSDHSLWKINGRDIIKLGENVVYTLSHKTGVNIGGVYSNNIRDLLTTTPLLPARNADGDYFVFKDMVETGWEVDQAAVNPLAKIHDQHAYKANVSHRIQSNIYLEIAPIKSLKFRSNFGYIFNFSSNRSYVPKYEWASKDSNVNDDITQRMSNNYRWSWENTLNWKESFGNHNLDVLVGQSVEKWCFGESLRVKNSNSLFENSIDYAYIDNTQGVSTTDTEIGGSPNTRGSLASFFGRINYNYHERYLVSFILRADGSSNFARGKRWGIFPSVSAGWILTSEPWMKNAKDVLSFFKIRASWGQNGNSDIAPFQYLATIAFGDQGRYYPTDKNTAATGAYPDILPNPDVTWEVSQQFDVGFDARLFKDRFSIGFDYYIKDTKNWLVVAPQLLSYGTGAPYINGGDVRNTGVEVALNWQDRAGDFNYSIGVNVSHNVNKVTRLANEEGILHGQANVIAQNIAEVYRCEVGKPMGFFYGYKTLGVFQNQAQIDAFTGPLVQDKSKVQPGDLIYADVNGDGKIDKDDLGMIGTPHPTVNMGININMSWKGIDLAINGYGAFGQDIIRCYRMFSNTPDHNYTNTGVNIYWTGEGSTNKYPRFTDGKNVNMAFGEYVPDSWVEDGSYFKISNITLGYDFATLWKAKGKKGIGKLRLFVTAKNCITFTGYKGMDPEVGYGSGDSWASGIDIGYYPSSRAILTGLSITF